MRKFSDEKVILVFKKSRGRCWYCGMKLSIESRSEVTTREMFVIDHFIPNGNNDISNLVPACLACNSAKNNYSMDVFRKMRSIQKAKKITREIEKRPHFSQRQIDYLRDTLGIALPPLPETEWHEFYFEKKGLSI